MYSDRGDPFVLTFSWYGLFETHAETHRRQWSNALGTLAAPWKPPGHVGLITSSGPAIVMVQFELLDAQNVGHGMVGSSGNDIGV